MTHVNLAGVPETMLWTLHNRASEAARPDGVLRDPKCLELHRSIPYDYERSFGSPEPSHAVRSAVFDAALRRFIAQHPNGVIVNLGEGLETQRFRLADCGSVLWISVDLPEAMAVRERFIASDASHVHVASSALDTRWFDAVPADRPVFVSAQGLLMYFAEDDVRRLLQAIAARFAGVELMFDYIPEWFARRSTSAKGLWRTKHYRVPPMPWGVQRSALPALLRAWLGPLTIVTHAPYEHPRGWRRGLLRALMGAPWVADRAPGMIHVRTLPR